MGQSIRNKAIVIGGNHYNTLGVIRSLGEKGIPVYLILVSEGESYVSKSRYVTEFWQVSKADSEILEVLRNNFDGEASMPVIIPTSDTVMTLLDNHMDSLKGKYILPNIGNSEGDITRLMNKHLANTIAEQSGFAIPRSFEVLLDGESICIPEDMVYPCIVKPLNSVDGKKKDITICENESTLTARLSELKGGYKKVLIQEYIDGKDSKMIEIMGCTTFDGKEVILPSTIEKIREYPFTAGSTSYATAKRESTYVDGEIVLAFLENINYRGIFDIEFKYSNGTTYFLEINFRNGAPGYALTRQGVNLPYIWLLDASGEDIGPLKKRIDKDYNFMMEARDFRHVLNGDLGPMRWMKDLLNTRAFLFFNIRDMRPWVSKLLNFRNRPKKVG